MQNKHTLIHIHIDAQTQTHTHTHTPSMSVTGGHWGKERETKLTSHWKGFSPVCVLLCSSRPRFWLKALLHSEHLYGFSCSQWKESAMNMSELRALLTKVYGGGGILSSSIGCCSKSRGVPWVILNIQEKQHYSTSAGQTELLGSWQFSSNIRLYNSSFNYVLPLQGWVLNDRHDLTTKRTELLGFLLVLAGCKNLLRY